MTVGVLRISPSGQAYDVGDAVTVRGCFGTSPAVLLMESSASSTAVTISNTSGYATGDKIIINPGNETEELNTIATITGQVVGLASAWIHPHHIREAFWERTDPTTVTLRVKGPSGATDSYLYATASSPVTQDTQGIYSKDLSISSAGTYYYRWEGTGAAQTAGEGQFSVRPSQFAT